MEAFTADMTSSDLAQATEVLGLLGADVLQRFVLVIDYPHARMGLIDPAVFDPDARLTPIPVSIDGGIVQVPIEVNGVQMSFLLDTGNSGPTLVLDPRGENLLSDEQRRFLISGGLRSGAGGSGDITPSHADLRIGPVVATNERLYVARAGSTDGTVMATQQGILGVGFLRSMRLSIDYSRSRLYLEPLVPRRDATNWMTYGLIARTHAGRLRVEGLSEEGPAARAGVHVGDEILSIEDIVVTQDNLALMGLTLSDPPPGARIHLRISSNGTERNIVLECVQIP